VIISSDVYDSLPITVIKLEGHVFAVFPITVCLNLGWCYFRGYITPGGVVRTSVLVS